MKHFVISALLLFSSLALAADRQASCIIESKSILGRSRSGVPQVSNLGMIEITCSAPARPWPSEPKPGFARSMLQLKTVTYQIGEGGTKTLVHSLANVTGAESNCGPPPVLGECSKESLFWSLNIPIDPAEAIAQLRAVTRKLEAEQGLSPEQRQQAEAHIQSLESHPDELAEVVHQYRPGHFIVECQIMDGGRLWAVGQVELEILFKGSAFNQLLDPAQQSR